MSLGFNVSRKIPKSTLPGMVNNTTHFGNAIPTKRSPNTNPPRPSPLSDTTPRPAPTRKEEVPLENEAADAKDWKDVTSSKEANVFVFATALRSVPPVEGEGLFTASKGDRMQLLYPMKDMTDEKGEETGKICMRSRVANPTTGEISEVWVVVYDHQKEERYVSDFSTCP